MGVPDQVVILGASGDLTRRKLIPALVRLDADPRPPTGFSILGVSRRPMTDEQFRAHLAESIPDDLREAFEALAPRIFYWRGDLSEEASVGGLEKRLDALPGGSEAGRLFYLSLRPDLFAVAVGALGPAGLLDERDSQEGFRRVVIEKPFGRDLRSAQELNRDLHEILHEEQIYRIDHYLGKETVQNLLGFRFHNSIFEPLWNRHLVELVQITAAETIGVDKGRGAYYDETGAVRDMVQNHLLQVLALVAMEAPSTIAAGAVRGQKLEVLRALRHPDRDERPLSIVRGRYGAGTVGDEPVRGYAQEDGVAADSTTETFVALGCRIENWRWSGVPFLLRHGKRLAQHFTEVQVQFRTPPIQLFNRPPEMMEDEYRRLLRDGALCQMRPNILSLRLQPQEGIQLSFGVKEPGNSMDMAPATLEFDYQEHFGRPPAEAYERLLADALLGDQTLFLHSDEIEESWRYADAVRADFDDQSPPPLHEYAPGSWGPEEATRLFGDYQGSWSRG
jgi:glucose-6-phosphate 1-dehydrogenase